MGRSKRAHPQKAPPSVEPQDDGSERELEPSYVRDVLEEHIIERVEEALLLCIKALQEELVKLRAERSKRRSTDPATSSAATNES